MGTNRYVEEVMTAPVIAVQPGCSAEDAIRQLTGRRIGGAPVVDASLRVLGIVTESDLLAVGGSAAGTVGDAMTSPAVTVTAATTVDEARAMLAARDIGRLPVVDGEGRLSGIISRRDLLATLLPDDEDIRHRVTDRVVDVGAEVYSVSVSHGSVVARGRVGKRSEMLVIERLLRETPGVTRVWLDFDYRTDDTAEATPAKDA
jgi:CBS domain-containing protein